LQFSEILLSLRHHRQLTQEELARELGISASYLSLLESGKRRVTRRILRSMAGYLDVPAGYFVVETENLDKLEPKHREIMQQLRRELVEPALERAIAKARKLPTPVEASAPVNEHRATP